MAECPSFQAQPRIDRLEYFMSQNIDFLGDILFNVGEGKEKIKFFKFVLQESSPVFQALLSDKWLNEGAKEISLPYDDPKAFRLFLWLISLEEHKNNFSMTRLTKLGLTTLEVLDLWHICKKYGVTGLETQCRDFLHDNLDVQAEDSLVIFDNIRGLDEEELEKFTLNFIRGNLHDLLFTDPFLELSRETMEEILSDGDNLVVDDLKLFKGLYRWSVFQCASSGQEVTAENTRSTLGDLLFQIRFHLIRPSDFESYVLPTKILLKEESDFFQMQIQMAGLNLNDEVVIKQNTLGKFSRLHPPRNITTETISTIPNHPVHYNRDLYLTRLTVSHMVTLYSFGFQSKPGDSTDYAAVVMLSPQEEPFISSLWTTARRKPVFHVHLPEPLVLPAKSTCTIRYILRAIGPKRGPEKKEGQSERTRDGCDCTRFHDKYEREIPDGVGIKFTFVDMSAGPLCEIRFSRTPDQSLQLANQ